MTRSELLEILKAEGLGSIYIGDGLPTTSDVWVVQEDHGLWQVCYVERGERTDEHWFADEGAACTYLINYLRECRQRRNAVRSQ